MKRQIVPFLSLIAASFAVTSTRSEIIELRPALIEKNGVLGIGYRAGETPVTRFTDAAPAGVELKLPGAAWVPVQFRTKTERDGVIELGPEKIGALTLRWRIAQKTPSLVERTLEVTADAAQRFSASFPLETAQDGEFASFSGPEKSRILYDTIGKGGDFNQDALGKGQQFPVAMVRASDRVFGIIADSPASWENRSHVLLDPQGKRLAVLTGDGRDPYPLILQKDRYMMDGWQSLAAGETRRYTTWLFASPARSHYDAQVAAHVALANAKGWNASALEAILRNTAFINLRRNLYRQGNADGRYIFTSGIGYGWKQWVSDGFWEAVALDDPEKTIEACRSVYLPRIAYEDNAQYYLIWSALLKRAGGKLDDDLARKAYEYIRKHEQDGVYVPAHTPNVKPPGSFKTYMDQQPYAEGDAPASNQGFHCGALMAAKELGLPVTDADVERAIAGYRGMFNEKRGFMPTSLKEQDILGQDTLYGATLTYAVFGRKLLTDEQVLAHYRTSERVKSPYGLRVISTAEGALLPGHNGSYTFGGSWFLCDAANYLLAGVHGLPAAEVDARLIERIQLEIARDPAFNESISTVTGKPYGHINYSWNSGYWWLRKQSRQRLGQTGPDPVGVAIDAHLGVVRENGVLRLEPDKAAKSPKGDDSPGTKPNIVLILADDLGYADLGCYGQRKIQTPNIDRLAQEGMRFRQFYAGASTCAPSRGVLMTGRHMGHGRVRGNASVVQRAKQTLTRDDTTVAAVLKQAGYATALVGKWGLGLEDMPGFPLEQGFDFFFGYLDQVHAHNYFPAYVWRNREKVRLTNEVRHIPVGKDGEWGISGIATKRAAYSPQLMLDEALGFISSNKDRPFFLYFATTLPHANNEAAKELGNGAEVPDLGIYRDKPWPAPAKGYAAMITYLDTQVGAILQRLKELGLDERTLVVFASDNGPEVQEATGVAPEFFQSAGPLRGLKRELYEGAIRVPFIARWPGKIQPGAESKHVGYFGDFLATAAELAGVKPPPGLDSVSLVPVWLGRPGAQRHEWLYWEYGERGFSQAALLEGRWKAVRNGRRDAPLDMYDLHADVGEQHNVAAEQPAIVGRMASFLQTAREPSDNWPIRELPPAQRGK